MCRPLIYYAFTALMACSGGSASRGRHPMPTAGSGSFYRTTFFANFDLDQTVTRTDGTLVLGGPYVSGVASSPVHEVRGGFTEVVPSFEASTPSGTWVVLKVSVRVAGTWSREYVMAVWASGANVVKRHSVDGQDDALAIVKTDTLVLSHPADALRLTVVLMADLLGRTPEVRAVAATANLAATSAPGPAPSVPAALGKVLNVPQRHQPDENSCSPASTSMLLAYWSAQLNDPALVEDVPAAEAGTFDALYNGYGNWPFNTAYAVAVGHGKLHGFVTRLTSLAQLERLIAASIPVAISVSYNAGELDGSPIKTGTDGHLLVVRGFTAKGDVVCNDPAFSSDPTVRVTYKRNQLETAWSHSNRTTYVIWPDSYALPQDPLGAY